MTKFRVTSPDGAAEIIEAPGDDLEHTDTRRVSLAQAMGHTVEVLDDEGAPKADERKPATPAKRDRPTDPTPPTET